ncbi:cathepsin O [Denticeps clupeoides]|uniref:Cathepsin O n=1 Tax=Denticeps clupeoides TaxID=299321 RepID=A0AAY4D103_9TELE|nr:cathepsin O [Denticeps clupeoides]
MGAPALLAPAWALLLCATRCAAVAKYDVSDFSPQLEKLSQRKGDFENATTRHVFFNSRPRETSEDSAQYGANQFSDLSPQEFRERYLTARAEAVPRYPADKHLGLTGKELPARFDWRDQGKVNPVQDQGSCGGCWAFSVVAAMETVNAMQGHPLVELSVQQVIDCCYVNGGCNGGSIVMALDWLNQTKVKLVQQSEYPYKAVKKMCHFSALQHDGVSVKDFLAYDMSGQEDLMKQLLVERGPLVVIVDALSWKDYLGGIIQHHCSSQKANHAVTISGYDSTGDIPYWIVRNSWGTSFGNEGYVYIKIGSNVCGIADSVAAVFL